MQIMIEMTEDDFDRLTTTSMKWAGEGVPGWDGPDWREQAEDGRFEPLEGNPLALPGMGWRWAFWMERWADVMFARAFLDAQGHACEVLWDQVDDGQYVVLSDYTTPGWQRAQDARADYVAMEAKTVADVTGQRHLRSASSE